MVEEVVCCGVFLFGVVFVFCYYCFWVLVFGKVRNIVKILVFNFFFFRLLLKIVILVVVEVLVLLDILI